MAVTTIEKMVLAKDAKDAKGKRQKSEYGGQETE